VAYRAEIEIAIKGASQLSSFQGKLDSTALAVDQLNKFLENFSDNAEGIPRSVSNLNRQLREAAQSFNGVALETKEATVAAVDYLTATRNLNAGLRERAQLLAEVAENERKAKLASAGIRERTQFPGPIGPGAASSTALSSPLPARSARTTQYLSPIFPGAASTFGTDQSLVGQSSEVGGRLARLRAIQTDDIKLQEALLALNRKTAQEKAKQVDAQEALVRGANEVKALVAEARGETISSSITGKKSTPRAEELSEKRFEKQNRTRRAEDIAREAALKSKANQEEFAALKTYQDELFNIERSFIRKLRNERIDAVLEAAEIEGKKQDELLQRIKRNNKEALDDFDKRLKASADKRKARSQALTLTGQTSPVGGAVDIPGSPAAIQRTARNKKLQRAASNAIIGGAFPLLFGQGAGASVGGAAGGALGGLAGGQFGFGLSLVGTALGTAFDELVKSAQDTAKALEDPLKNLDALNEKFNLLDKTTKKTVDALIKVGEAQKASNIIQEKISEVIGKEGIDNLRELGLETQKTAELFGELKLALEAIAAGPLSDVLSIVNQGLKVQLGRTVSENLRKDLSKTDLKEFDKQIAKAIEKTVKQRFGKEGKSTRTGDAAANYLSILEPDELLNIVETFRGLRSNNVDNKSITAEQQAQANLTKLQRQQSTLSAQLTALSTTDTFTKAVKKQQELQTNYDKQRADILKSYEENLGNIRESVEQRILALRIQGIQKANEIENQRAANQLSELQRINRAASQQQRGDAVAAGTRPELAATAQTIDDAFRSIAEAELSAEQKKAQIERDAAFEVLKLELDGEKFKVQIAKQVSQLNLNTARKIEDINLNIARANEVTASNRFDLELAIAKLRLDVLKQEQESTRLLLVNAGAFEAAQQVQTVIDAIRDERLKLENAKPVQQLNPLAAVGGEDVSTAGVDTVENNLIERQRLLTAERLKSVDILKAANKEAELAKISGIRIADQKTIKTLLLQQVDAITAQQRILELQTEGRSKEQAVAIQQTETTFKLIDANLGVAESKLKTELAALQAVEADKKDLEIIEKIKQELQDVANLKAGLPLKKQEALENAANKNPGKIKAFVDQMQIDLADTEGMVVSLAQSVESSLATAMSSAVQSIVTGTGSVQEAFSDMFANIGKAFIDMATQMIAKALIMKAVGILTSSFGGGSSPGIERALAVTPKTGAAATSTLNNFLSFRANGGPVSANTPYIVGERGPELMIPSTSGMVLSNSETRQQLTQQGSAMRSTEATRQQLNTQRNTMITNSTRETERMTEMMLSNPDPIDVRYESTVINNVEYVTAEQHRQGMAQAAERGRSLTLSALQGSVKTRKKVGLS
jgi:hypothetical protein